MSTLFSSKRRNSTQNNNKSPYYRPYQSDDLDSMSSASSVSDIVLERSQFDRKRNKTLQKPNANLYGAPLSPVSRKTTVNSTYNSNSLARRPTKQQSADEQILSMSRSSSSSENISRRPYSVRKPVQTKRTSTISKMPASTSEETLGENDYSSDASSNAPLPRRQTTSGAAAHARPFADENTSSRAHIFLPHESPSNNNYSLVRHGGVAASRESSVMSSPAAMSNRKRYSSSKNVVSYNEDYENVRQSMANPLSEFRSGNNTIFAENALPPTPSHLIFQRLKGWKNVIHILHSAYKDQAAVEKQYAQITAKHAQSWIASSSLDRDVAFGSEDGSMTNFLDSIKKYSRDLGREHDEIYRILSNETVPVMASLERDVDNKIATLGSQLRRREEILRKDAARLFTLQSELMSSLAVHHGTNPSVSVTSIGDPWLKNVNLKKHLRAYINRFDAAHQSEDSLDVNYEIWEKNAVENLKTSLQHYTTITSIGTMSDTTNILRDCLMELDAEAEWDKFFEDKLCKARMPDGPDIEYEGWDDPFCTAVREGVVLRKAKYTKSWNKVWWVLTSAGWLHEFKARPNLSGIDPIKPKRSFWLRGITLSPLGGMTNSTYQEFHLFERPDMSKSTKTKVHKYMTDSVVESEFWFNMLSHFAAGTLSFTKSYDYNEKPEFRDPRSFIAEVDQIREQHELRHEERVRNGEIRGERRRVGSPLRQQQLAITNEDVEDEEEDVFDDASSEQLALEAPEDQSDFVDDEEEEIVPKKRVTDDDVVTARSVPIDDGAEGKLEDAVEEGKKEQVKTATTTPVEKAESCTSSLSYGSDEEEDKEVEEKMDNVIVTPKEKKNGIKGISVSKKLSPKTKAGTLNSAAPAAEPHPVVEVP